MIVQKEFLSEIKNSFRLNIYEVKIWAALLSRGIASAGELSDISGVPRSRSYDVLESLERKGFVIMKIGKPIKYIAVQPEEVMQRVEKGLKDEAERRALFINSVKNTPLFKELELLHKSGSLHKDISELSNAIVGRSNISHFIKGMIERAKKKVTIVTTKEGFKRKSKIIKSAAKKTGDRNIRIKIIAPVDRDAAKKLSGVEIKDRETNMRMVSADDKEVLFMLSDDNVEPDYDVGVWINSEFFVNEINFLFEDILK